MSGVANPPPAEDRALTPVVGIVLLVGITVALAAVVGTFALGMTDALTEPAPRSMITVDEVDAEDDELALVHGGGDDLAFEETTIVVVDRTTDERTTFRAADGAGAWSTAQRLTIDVGTSPSAAAIGGDDAYATADVDGIDAVEVGHAYSIAVVHEPSGATIIELDATA